MQPTLLITRPEPGGARFAQAFSDINIILSPLQKVTPLDATCNAQGVIFTSENGVAQASRLGITSGPAWCVGNRTMQAAQNVGFDAISANGDAEDLLRLLLADPPDISVAHIRGGESRGDVGPRLRAAGVDCVDCVAYEQSPMALTPKAVAAIKGAEPVIIPLFSPRAAHLLLEQITIGPNIRFVAISQNVAEVVSGLNCLVAERPNGIAMIDATQRALAAL